MLKNILKNALKKRVLLTAMLTSIAVISYAEEAPVFDADNYPPQFDEQQGDNAPSPQSSSGPSLSIDQRIGRLEQQIINLQRVDSSDKMNVLQGEVQSLRGQVEQLSHQLQQLQTQQRTQYSDLDKRMNNKEPVMSTAKAQPATVPDETIPQTEVVPASASAKIKQKPVAKKLQPGIPADTIEPAVVTEKVAATPEDQQISADDEQKTYQLAYDLTKAKKYSEAIAVLQKVVQKNPSAPGAGKAHYWLGELYGLSGKSDQSAAEYSAVVNNFPNSPKVSDAQLKLGMIYAAQFKWVEAKSSFKKVISHYPGSASARLAAEQMKQIKSEGH